MKVGIECEGRLKGVPTIFCQAAELEVAIEYAVDSGVGHLYVSDLANALPYARLASINALVTLEVTEVQDTARPSNVTLMLSVPGYANVAKLSSTDQVKFEHDLNVLVAPAQAFFKTQPSEFSSDLTV